MKRQDTDILISGGGVAGLTAAAAFGAAGFGVICVDPALPVTDDAAAGADLRTTAFLFARFRPGAHWHALVFISRGIFIGATPLLPNAASQILVMQVI